MSEDIIADPVGSYFVVPVASIKPKSRASKFANLLEYARPVTILLSLKKRQRRALQRKLIEPVIMIAFFLDLFM